jgi:hypothetical protein
MAAEDRADISDLIQTNDHNGSSKRCCPYAGGAIISTDLGGNDYRMQL